MLDLKQDYFEGYKLFILIFWMFEIIFELIIIALLIYLNL